MNKKLLSKFSKMIHHNIKKSLKTEIELQELFEYFKNSNKNEDKQDTESDINFPEIESWSEIF